MAEPVLDTPAAPITIGSLALSSTIKLGLAAIGCVWITVGLIYGLLALFGIAPVQTNGAPTYGLVGLLSGIVIGVIFTLLSTAVFALGALIAVNIPWIARRPLRVLQRRRPD